jgi:hypothetical protein
MDAPCRDKVEYYIAGGMPQVKIADLSTTLLGNFLLGSIRAF